MRFSPLPFGAVAALALLAACDEPLDFDLRGGFGGFTTADAALGATAARPNPDARGVITYPNYQVVVAKRDETARQIAGRLGLNADKLARYNGVGPDVKLRAGEVLALPGKIAAAPPSKGVDIAALAGEAIDSAPATTPVESKPLSPAPKPVTAAPTGPEPVRHKVERGETAYTIARLYQVPVKALAEWNGLGPDFAIREDQFLLIPVPQQAAPRRTPAQQTTQPGQGSPTPTPPSAQTALPDEQVAPATKPTEAPAQVIEKPTRASSAEMAYPVQGRIIRTYKKGKNEGLDIAGTPGQAVNAAANGTVAAITEDADKVPIIVIRHPDNLLTVYANVDQIAVKKGDSVKRGQKLAALRSGDDAYVHFEVRDGFDSVDPTPYLE